MKQTSTLPIETSDPLAYWADRDSPPMTVADLQKARIIPRVTTLRRALKLTQEDFSQKFRIPIGTLQDWEQSRTTPDAAARAYLLAIAGDAQAVLGALAKAGRGAA